MKNLLLKLVLLVLLVLYFHSNGHACSMYKVSANGKTMVGCNEDAWRLTSRIWFETGKDENHYGAGFTGSRYDGSNGFAPQSGMNAFGLAFSRLSSHAPDHQTTTFANKKPITSPTLYLKDILHRCKTVEEVKSYIEKYDHSYFQEDVFIYIDQSGSYLVVEPYQMTIGREDKYVLSNFCPSVTKESDALKLGRYRNGVEFLKNKIDTSLDFCTALSDTMHVCRSKIGDGTLLTSIWDLNSSDIHLYFYHDYTNRVQFNLQEELAKGDHIIEIPSLFPPNPEFEALANYKIPANTLSVALFLLGLGGFFFCSAIFFLIAFFKKKNAQYAYLPLGLCFLGFVMFSYMGVLALPRHLNLFYFPAPYFDAPFSLLSITAYIPYIIGALMIPLVWANIKIIKANSWDLLSKAVLTMNNIAYTILIGLFVYWGLF